LKVPLWYTKRFVRKGRLKEAASNLYAAMHRLDTEGIRYDCCRTISDFELGKSWQIRTPQQKNKKKNELRLTIWQSNKSSFIVFLLGIIATRLKSDLEILPIHPVYFFVFALSIFIRARISSILPWNHLGSIIWGTNCICYPVYCFFILKRKFSIENRVR
jgi:hypothetical protein